jgi:hypothetical protein
MSHVIMTGNPIDGFQLFGPFTSSEEAAKFTDQIDGIELWVLPISDPVMLTDPVGEG